MNGYSIRYSVDIESADGYYDEEISENKESEDNNVTD